MTTTTEEPIDISQDDLDYFTENFTMQGLKYIRLELMRDIGDRRNEINHLESELNRIKDRIEWHKSGLEGQRIELKNISAAMEHLKKVSIEL
jgi:HAMP domain-containing protein